MPKRKKGAKGLFESVIEIDRKQIRHIQIRHKEKRVKKLLRKVSKRLKTDYISKDVHAKKELIRKYVSILNFNAFVHIIKQYSLNKVTIYDPKGLIAYRLQEVMRYVKFLRIVTDNTDIYTLYNEECFEKMGCYAAICNKLPKGKQQLVFCVSSLPMNYDAKGAFIIGEGGYNSVIDTSLSQRIAQKCPEGIDIKDFFTSLAIICSCHTPLNAIPYFLECNGRAKSVNALSF